MADIKKLPKKDLNHYAEIASGAFPGMGMNTPEKIKELEKALETRHASEHATFYGLYKKEKTCWRISAV